VRIQGAAVARVDLLPELDSKGKSESSARSDWNKIHELSAVKNGRVYVLTAYYAVIPGPRFIQTLEEMARLIHPEWEGR
jgi:ABC-type Fe3+-hydroxamate transport system substrate-binding protein